MNNVFASNLIKYFELIAGLVGVFCYVKNKQSIWFAFAIYLVLLFFMEYSGYWLLNQQLYKQNIYLYKLFVIPSLFLVYHFLFYKILHQKNKKYIIVSVFLFLAAAILENTFLQKEHFYSISITLSYGCLAVLFFSLQYFFQLMKSDELLNYHKLMPFWFCTGLLLFYLGSFCKLSFFNSLVFSKNSELAKAFNWVFIFLNYIMYSLFTIGFIWSKPK